MARPPRKKHPLIALLIPDNEDDAFFRSVVDTATELDWQLLDLVTTRRKLPPGIVPQGAILSQLPDDPLVQELMELGVSCVRKGTFPHSLDSKMPAILPDNMAAGRMAADHFAALGFKHVGYIINKPRANTDLKFEGLQERSEELGMEFHMHTRGPNERPEVVEPKMGKWLRDVPKPIGILAFHDILAVRLNLIAQSVGLSVPEEVALLGPSNAIQCETSPVPISAIEMDQASHGRQAALLLHRMMEGETIPERTYIAPKKIVVRRSTDVLAVPDLVVAKAMTYIWDHFNWPLTVDDVAFEAGVARSTLERKFRQNLGRGVNGELRRKRLEKCCELLRATKLNLAEIAKATGFNDRSYLHRVFLKEMGKTPAAYRRQNKA